MKPVLVTTEYKGIFAGLVPDDLDLRLRRFPLKRARMAITWGTTKGFLQLAETGPTVDSEISGVADIEMLHGVTSISTITPEAWEKWESA